MGFVTSICLQIQQIYAGTEFVHPTPETFHGSGITVSAPGVGVIAHIAGLDLPDGTHRGVYRFVDDPDVATELCAALTA